MTKGIKELLLSRAQLVDLFQRVEIKYIKDDENSEFAVREKTLPECLADALINEILTIQDRR